MQRALSRPEGKWWALGLLDSATVASATGSGAFVARRDRRVAAQLLVSAVALRVQLWLRWPALAASLPGGAPGAGFSGRLGRLFGAAPDGEAEPGG